MVATAALAEVEAEADAMGDTDAADVGADVLVEVGLFGEHADDARRSAGSATARSGLEGIRVDLMAG